MKTQSQIILFCIFFVSFHSTCKRYEEGPFFTLLTVEQRVKNQKYIDSYTVNGIDSMQYLIDSVFHCSDFRFWFFDKCSETFVSIRAGWEDDYYSGPCTGFASVCLPENAFFYDKRKHLNFNCQTGYPFSLYPFVLSYKKGEASNCWKIIRLTKKEMWLKVEDDRYPNKIFEMKFVAEK